MNRLICTCVLLWPSWSCVLDMSSDWCCSRCYAIWPPIQQHSSSNGLLCGLCSFELNHLRALRLVLYRTGIICCVNITCIHILLYFVLISYIGWITFRFGVRGQPPARTYKLEHTSVSMQILRRYYMSEKTTQDTRHSLPKCDTAVDILYRLRTLL